MSDLAEFRELHELEGGGWHYIYGLCDPRTGELRYVGKSDNPTRRYADQLRDQANTHRGHWIQELARHGLKPVQTILDAVPVGTDWQTVERAYIVGARQVTLALTNGTDGGDGVPGLSLDARQRVRATWLGRKHRPESLTKIGAASRGRKHTNAWREYMSERMRTRDFSPEHRQKIRAATQKLTPEQVREIRTRLAAGERQRDIAAMFSIHQGSVSNIARGLTYRDVGEQT